jgi:hypothetical protein
MLGSVAYEALYFFIATCSDSRIYKKAIACIYEFLQHSLYDRQLAMRIWVKTYE